MKKIFLIGALAVAGFFCQDASAQGLLQNLLGGKTTSSITGESTSDTKQNVGNLIGNLISSVTGDLTTTQANLIGAILILPCNLRARTCSLRLAALPLPPSARPN